MTGIETTAVVTGGSSGIGRAIVARLASAGYQVAFMGLTKSRVLASLNETKEKYPDASLIGEVVDIRDVDSIKQFFANVVDEFGDVGVLVNSAGISPKVDGKRIPIHALNLEQFEDVCRVNLTAPLLCAQRVLPSMMVARFGRIIMIGSIAARSVPQFAGSAYVASKAGLAGLTRSLAAEYGEYGITSNVISPGNVASAMTGPEDSAQNREAASRIPVGRIGKPSDCGSVALFLASPDAGFINGATIDVTGGEYVPA